MARNVQLYGVDWRFVLSCVILLTWITVFLLYVISLIYGKLHFHRKRSRLDDEEASQLPGVTIIKPLNSVSDPNLLDNLSTFFSLNYPKFEILMCVQDEDNHELIKLVTGLITKFPSVDAQMFVGAQNVGVNPKINNMMNGYEAAKYPLLLISDASIAMKEDTLTDMVSHLSEKVGLVHQFPSMMDGKLEFSRVIEKVYFGGAHARYYISANACGLNCMTSMSCLFRKKILEEEGGLKSLSCYLGEDYFLAQLIINKGWRLALSSQPTGQNPGMTSFSAYRSRMMRWMYMRMAAIPQLYVLEPLTEHSVLAPLSSLAVQYMLHIPFYVFLPAHLLVWCLMDYLLIAVIENRRPSFSLCNHMRAWLLREAMFLYLFIKVLPMRYVSWGGHKFKVHCGGVTERVGDKPHLSLNV